MSLFSLGVTIPYIVGTRTGLIFEAPVCHGREGKLSDCRERPLPTVGGRQDSAVRCNTSPTLGKRPTTVFNGNFIILTFFGS